MRKIFLTLSVAALAALQLSAQNLNPQVQVTNDYQTRLSDVSKMDLIMQVPDSLQEFSTNVDYSVFNTDYKGAYDFDPYPIRVTPKATDYSGNQLFVRTGLGFTFRPVLNAVYTPVKKGLHRLTVYNDFHGYAGRYHRPLGSAWTGSDFQEKMGAEGRWNKETFDLSWDASYSGIFSKDYLTRSTFNDINAGIRICSNVDTTTLFYDFKVRLGVATDRFGNGNLVRMNEASYLFDGTIGPEIYHQYIRLLIDIHAQSSSYNLAYSEPLTLNYLTPRAVFDWGPLNVSGGLTLCTGGKSLGLYPDVRANLMLWGDVLNVYGFFGGRQFAEDYSALKTRDHWMNTAYFFGDPDLKGLKTTVEQFNITLGLRGSIASRVQYDVKGGFVSYARAAMDQILFNADSTACASYIGYRDYKTWFLNGKLSWRSERFDADAQVELNKTSIGDDKRFLDLPSFATTISAVYNGDRRIFGGIRIKGATPRNSLDFKVKGYADVGLYGEYRISPMLSAWAQWGNILCRSIPVSPVHQEHGMHLTGGICLRLQ